MSRALVPLRPPSAAPAVADVLARSFMPRRAITVSQWADAERMLSSKGSAEPGRWVTDRNPPLREPMDCFSALSPVRDVVMRFPIQAGKTEVAINVLGYTMDRRPGPIMVCLPGEVSQQKWVAQKLQPMIDETPAVKATLTSTSSREAANTRTFKDFAGGQLYIEHAGSTSRLKSTSVRLLIADELDEFAANFAGGDDPVEMLNGRTSAFPGTSKRLYISTPQLKGSSRIDFLWERSDQRLYHVPCPHCGHLQPMQWGGLQWSPTVHPEHGRQVWLTCGECGAAIEETSKTDMLAAGRWVPTNPGARTRGYHVNCLYYPIGLGPRWADLVEMWLDAQGDKARLKTFINDRLAEPWEDEATRHVKANVVADRAEPYALRTAPEGVLAVTAGVDTQDNRLAVQILGWGAAGRRWVLDYVELPGDPAQDAVWAALNELLNRPILHANGAPMSIDATAIDAAGHRTEAVKAWVRDRRVRRPMVIFGAVPNNAPPLSKPKPMDVNWRGQNEKRGVMGYHVGTVGIKHMLYAALAADADYQAAWAALPDSDDKPAAAQRLVHFSDELPPDYFPGLISEVFNPAKNRYEKRRGGVRNEPLDTFVYATAAGYHPELRLHRVARAEWERRAALLAARAERLAAQPPAAAGAPAAPPEKPPAAWHSYRARGQQPRAHRR